MCKKTDFDTKTAEFVEAFETILMIEKTFGTQLREYAVRTSKERYALREDNSCNLPWKFNKAPFADSSLFILLVAGLASLSHAV